MIDGSPCITWNFSDCSVALPDSATATQLCRRYHQYAHCVCRCSDACRLIRFRTSPAACWCCSSSRLCSETLLYCRLSSVATFTFIQIFNQILTPLLNSVEVSAFAWYSVKIRVIFGVWFESRKVDKKSKPAWKLKHAKSILKTFEYFCQISPKLIVIISSYTDSVGSFFRV